MVDFLHYSDLTDSVETDVRCPEFAVADVAEDLLTTWRASD
jgi:hypothetical protein